MNFKVTKGDNIRFLLVNVPENQKDTVLKSFDKFTVEEVSDKEVEELSGDLTVMKVAEPRVPSMDVDAILPKDYEKPISFEKPRTTKRSWERPYKYHR